MKKRILLSLAFVFLLNNVVMAHAEESPSLSNMKSDTNKVAVTEATKEKSILNSDLLNQNTTMVPNASEKEEGIISQARLDSSATKASMTSKVKLTGMTWQKITSTGSEVNFGVAHQSKSDLVFNWMYYDLTNKTWMTINPSISSNWITFKAPHSGQYLIHVIATNAEGQSDTYTIGWKVADDTLNLKGMTWQNVTKDCSKASIGVAYTSNNQVTFTWQYYDIIKKEWHPIAKDITSNWINFSVPHSGQYLIYVSARTANGIEKTYSIGWQVANETINLKGMTWQIVPNDLTDSNFGISSETNTSVTYNWQYYDISKKEWHTITDQTPSNWTTFSAPHVGQYLIRVEAKTPNGLTKDYVIGWNEKSRHKVTTDSTILSNESQNMTKLIAHRGNSSIAPENTTAAFTLAKGAYGVETDILLTKDHHWIISHDSTVDRMSNGSGRVSDLTLAQIKSLKIKNGVNIQNYPGLTIATLEEYLGIMNQIGARPVIEIKEGPERITPNDIANLLHALNTYNLTSQALIISFYLDDLKLVYQQNQTLEMSLLYAGNFTQIQFDALIKEMPNTGLDINDAFMSPEVSNLLHENGRKVGIWTTPLNSVNRYLDFGIDYFTTNQLK